MVSFMRKLRLRYEARLKKLKSMCGYSDDYVRVIYELDPLLEELLGKQHTITRNFQSIIQSDQNTIQKLMKIRACIEALENAVDLRRQEKRYQVFISSTYLDLIEYRKVVADEVSFLKHIPAGMEDFAASGTNLDTYIKSVIDESNYYVLLIGQRYGTEYQKGVSYTMFEYQYARKKGFNIIPFIYNGSELLKNNDLEFNKEKLNAFKNEVMSLTPQYFASKDELVRKFTKALNAEITRNPQRGWIRL